jgi:hypothetical protein
LSSSDSKLFCGGVKLKLICMQFDESLTVEALNLADGSDIHDVAGMVAMYRSVAREGCDATELERELRRYVAGKRLQRGQFCLASK